MSEHKVFVTRKVHDEALDILKKSCIVEVWNSEELCPREELLKRVKGVDAIYCTISDEINVEVLDAAGPQLKIVGTMSSGKHHICEYECRKRNIYVSNVPDVAADSAAEMTVTLLLVTARRAMEGLRAVENGEWGLWKPMWICGIESFHRTLGIVGFGRVGFGVARRMKPFGLKRILYTDISHQTVGDDLGAEFVELDTLVRESDYIVITTALTTHTRKLINKAALEKMKPTAVLVNTSRGPIVDTDALVDALKNKKIAAAGLDVTDPQPLPADHPLVGMDNCIITPHLGTNSTRSRLLMATETSRNIIAHMKHA